jgi:hypothetical protein
MFEPGCATERDGATGRGGGIGRTLDSFGKLKPCWLCAGGAAGADGVETRPLPPEAWPPPPLET